MDRREVRGCQIYNGMLFFVLLSLGSFIFPKYIVCSNFKIIILASILSYVCFSILTIVVSCFILFFLNITAKDIEDSVLDGKIEDGMLYIVMFLSMLTYPLSFYIPTLFIPNYSIEGILTFLSLGVLFYIFCKKQ